MAILQRLFRSNAAANIRPIHTSSLLRTRTCAPSLLPRLQRQNAPLSTCRTVIRSPTASSFQQNRRQHTIRPSKPLTEGGQPMTPEDEARMQARRDEEPAYLIYFTCKPCGHRSAHRITKHGYHKGTVLIACPNCRNRHVISDHLKIFGDKPVTLEEILAQKGQKVTKGAVQGDLEWWDDASTEQSDSSSKTEDTAEAGKSEKS
ncbi:hypothetical protein VTO42DRAFT_254 [Malbranchea cinnamomea]